MGYKVNFKDIEIVGLEQSPYAASLAGLRANEARYFWNKFKFEYTVFPAEKMEKQVEWLAKILKEEKDIIINSKVLEVAIYEDENIYWPDFIFENGMILNVLYEKEGEKPKRAVGIKLCQDMEIPAELKDKFKFARQRSKLAGEIRGSYFKLKNKWM